METNQQNTTGKVVTALIIGLILGFASGAFWQERRMAFNGSVAPVEIEGEQPVLSGLSSKTDDFGTATSTLRISVQNQDAGSKVVVAEAVVDVPTWIAVREDQEGKLGNILGAQKVFPGVSRDIVVELLRPTLPRVKYHAVFYRDAGSPAFNYREDVLIVDVEALFETKADE